MEQSLSLDSLLQRSSEEIGIQLNEKHITQFLVYLDQLQTWNRSFNLTSITSGEEIVIKHFVDSLAALTAENISPHSSLLDIGTGAGFPGLPLKIVRPDLAISLIEPSRKKSSFLRFMVGHLHLEDVAIFSGPLDRYVATQTSTPMFDYITSRALKHDVVLSSADSLLRTGGKMILYSSQPILQESLGADWRLVSKYAFDLPHGYGARVISTAVPVTHAGSS